ncbi:hypothetical protein DM02DRAFT_671664 [Periconia macrospinosa]|uniref:Uncharacterized protein n=1 Tax=Periconia macrospinosa TaxID=97972 RepID=A0A2V1DUF5_9PLEO|nr:hypothetical protein DM02DRAFT_671664 [Periconia macrospinosa]
MEGIPEASKKRKREDDLEPTTQSIVSLHDSNNAEIIRQFWSGHISDDSAAKLLSEIIAQEVKLSTPPDTATIFQMARYRQLFGSSTNPFNSMAWIKFLEGSNQLEELGELDFDTLKYLVTKKQQLLHWGVTVELPLKCRNDGLSPRLAFNMTRKEMGNELKMHATRIGQIRSTLKNIDSAMKECLEKLEEESRNGWTLIKALSEQNRLTILEYPTPPLLTDLVNDPNKTLNGLSYESLYIVYGLVEQLRLNARFLHHCLCEFRVALPKYEESSGYDTVNSMKASLENGHAWVDRIMKMNDAKSFENKLVQITQRAKVIATVFAKQQSVLHTESNYDGFCDGTQDQRDRCIERQWKRVSARNVSESVARTNGYLKIRAMIRVSRVEKIIEILNQFAKRSESFRKLSLSDERDRGH